MVAHMDRHELSETVEFSVYDSMHRCGGRVVYGGRIFNGSRSHGIGVKPAKATAPSRFWLCPRLILRKQFFYI